MLNGIASAIPATLMLFFVQDRLQLPASAQAQFLGAYFLAAAVSVPLWLQAIARWGLRRCWLAGRRLSQADLVAAGHLSVLDYFGEVSWGAYPALKTWYMKLKSRPCFRPLLADRFIGVAPAAWYAELDF